MEGKKTPLYEIHLAAEAKMVEFGGWLMPVQYTGIKEEHQAVREKAGLFDVSHMGEFTVKGEEALAFLQKVVTNDVSLLQDYQVQYTPMCYENGGTVDDLLIYRFAADDYLLVVNGSNIKKDWEWLQKNKVGFLVELTDISEITALLALQGPQAEKILSKLTNVNLSELFYYRFLPEVTVAGCEVTLSRTGYTGEDGFEIYAPAQDAKVLWQKLLEAGQQEGLVPAGLGARDTLRFEASLPLYGHELSVSITPVEAGIGMFVKPDKGEFNGREVLRSQKQNGAERKIVGLEMIGRGIARADYPVYAEGELIGQVTTGSVAPTLGKNLGLALLEKEYTSLGQEVFVEIRGKQIAAQIIAKPFYKRKG